MHWKSAIVGGLVAWWLFACKDKAPCDCDKPKQECPNDPDAPYGNGNHTPYTVGATPCAGCSDQTDFRMWPGCG
jgi:hypothetical protein